MQRFVGVTEDNPLDGLNSVTDASEPERFLSPWD